MDRWDSVASLPYFPKVMDRASLSRLRTKRCGALRFHALLTYKSPSTPPAGRATARCGAVAPDIREVDPPGPPPFGIRSEIPLNGERKSRLLPGLTRNPSSTSSSAVMHDHRFKTRSKHAAATRTLPFKDELAVLGSNKLHVTLLSNFITKSR